MKKIKVLLTRKYYDIDKTYISEKLFSQIGDNFLLVDPQSYSEENIIEAARDVDVLFGPFISDRLLQHAINLKLIQIPWAGLDDFNFEIMKNYSIPVCNSHSNSSAVAEFAVSLTLNLAKKINFHDSRMRKNDWNRSEETISLKSKMIESSNICILGYGSIGRKIGKIFKSFGANIYAVTRNPQTYPEVEEIFPSDEWTKAVRIADIIICTLPLTDLTKEMINQNSIDNFKKDSIIINVSRSEIFNEEALYHSLINKQISGYASDVWWKSPSRGNSNSKVSSEYLFEELENVLLSPHRAGFVEGMLPHLDDAINNVVNVFLNKPLINVIDIEKHY